jgi:hypothetical protein
MSTRLYDKNSMYVDCRASYDAANVEYFSN